MDRLSLFLGILGFVVSVGLHSVVRRCWPAVNSVLVYTLLATAIFFSMVVGAQRLHASTVVMLASFSLYCFCCELYVFLVTFVAGSVSVARLLDVATGDQPRPERVSPEKMVSARLAGLEACHMVRRNGGALALSLGGRLMVSAYQALNDFFAHARKSEIAREYPIGNSPTTSARARIQTQSLIWMLLMALLACTVFREHIMRTNLFLGNFDRLNSTLNVQLNDVESLKVNESSAWDNSMFMGRNVVALPFTLPGPFNRLLALLPIRQFYWLAGYISIALVIFAGWSEFVLILDIVGDPFPAFVGGTLYQFCALSVLHASQNTLSYAVLIDLPLLFLVNRKMAADNWCRCFVFETILLCHLFFYCFLQEVAYALLALGCYAVLLACLKANLRIVVALAFATLVAAIFSFPRVYGIAEDMSQLSRRVADDFPMKDFDAIYKFQNIQPVDILRWFNDGLFGRFYGEMQHLNNNINITEGMLAYSSTLAPFLVLGGLVFWKAQWFGLFRTRNLESLFFYVVILAVFAVFLFKAVYKILFYAFLRVDFTHTRILVAVVPLLYIVVAEALATFRAPDPITRRGVMFALSVVAGSLGIAINSASQLWTRLALSCKPIPLMASFKGLIAPYFIVASGLFGGPWKGMPASGRVLIWLYPRAVAESFVGVLIVLSLFTAVFVYRRRPLARTSIFLVTGFIMVCQAWSFANFQVNGPQVHSPAPFNESDSFVIAPPAFAPPSNLQLREMHSILQTEGFRTVFSKAVDPLPPFTAPHLGAFWQLRLVEGYSSGVPSRLAMLPWPEGTLGLRTLTFGYTPRTTLPWDLLGFLNVRFSVEASMSLYENLVPPGSKNAIPQLSLAENPSHVVPRIFFASQALCVKNEFSAAFAIRSVRNSKSRFIDPEVVSVVETTKPLHVFSDPGSIVAKYTRDHVSVDLSPSPRSRLLVLNELFEPRWHAYENGKQVPVYPANLVMRSVVVSPGVSSVSFDFEPFYNPTNITIFTVLASIVACASIALLALMPARIFGAQHP